MASIRGISLYACRNPYMSIEKRRRLRRGFRETRTDIGMCRHLLIALLLSEESRFALKERKLVSVGSLKAPRQKKIFLVSCLETTPVLSPDLYISVQTENEESETAEKERNHIHCTSLHHLAV